MPGSINSVPESPQIMKYCLSVVFLVFSLCLAAYGYANNAWIVLSKDNDEFQRGVRGLDCFKENEPIQKIACLPWGAENKTSKFPVPFVQVEDPSILVHIGYYLALVILFSQLFWLCYTVGHCISCRFCRRVEVYKLAFFHAMVTVVGFWIILFVIFIVEAFSENILPENLKKPEWKYSIGSGCWFFFAGGLFPFIAALFCLFKDQMEKSQEKLLQLIRRRRNGAGHVELSQLEPKN
uniref:Uncharacterized protein n=1 Tax=Caenorhabditis tropicalis TaxID=1561998 RepID=A0A1I7TJ56_9PELO